MQFTYANAANIKFLCRARKFTQESYSFLRAFTIVGPTQSVFIIVSRYILLNPSQVSLLLCALLYNQIEQLDEEKFPKL